MTYLPRRILHTYMGRRYATSHYHTMPLRIFGVVVVFIFWCNAVAVRSRRRDSTADVLLETCIGALDLLLELSENCTALMSPYANVVGDLVLGGGGALLVVVDAPSSTAVGVGCGVQSIFEALNLAKLDSCFLPIGFFVFFCVCVFSLSPLRSLLLRSSTPPSLAGQGGQMPGRVDPALERHGERAHEPRAEAGFLLGCRQRRQRRRRGRPVSRRSLEKWSALRVPR